MRRREFITLLGGAAVWPFAAHAQQPAMSVIGILGGSTRESDGFRVAAIRQGLKETGYVEGQNVAFEYRWAEDHNERLPALAADLVRRKVALIVSMGGNASAVAAKPATSTIPIVFAVGADPIKLGLVASLNRPGGNMTGVSFLNTTLIAKQFEILHETVPKTALIGCLFNQTAPSADADIKTVQAAAELLGQKILVLHASTDRELEAAFVTLAQQRAGALMVVADAFFNNRRDKLVELTARQKMPTIHVVRAYPAAGGLMSYGTSLTEAYRLVGVYTGRILKGEKPADLPVQQSTKVELVINLKTAKALGLTVPPQIVARADEVIE